MPSKVAEIHIDRLTYSEELRPALAGIDLSVEEGDFMVITGPPGAGKSSLLLTLNGTIPQYVQARLEGTVTVGGRDTKSTPIYELARDIGLVFEDPDQQLIAPTVEEEVAFGPINLGIERKEVRDRVRWALEICRLKKYANIDPSELSGGMRQELALAGVLAMNPKIMALDEPTALLDPLGTSQVISTLAHLNRELGVTIIMATQNLESVSDLATKLVIIDEGNVKRKGTFEDIISDVDLLQSLGINSPQVTRLAFRLGIQPLPKNLKEALERFPKPETEALGTRPLRSMEQGKEVVRVENLHHVYDNGIEALKGVSLRLTEGEVHALIGQNGSGKTTLAKHLVGLLRPSNSDARIEIYGIDVTKAAQQDLIRVANYAFQNPDHQIFSQTVSEEISFGPRNIGMQDPEARARQLLSKFGLSELAHLNPRTLDRYTKRLIGVLSVLALEPRILILDEPTNGLDAKSSASLMDLVTASGLTILFITHDMELVAKYAQGVTVLRDGEVIASGNTEDILSDEDALRSTWLQPPEVFRLMKGLGISTPSFTVDDAIRYFAGGVA